MAAYSTISEQFYMEVLSEFVPELVVDQLAQRKEAITRTRRGLAVTFTQYDRTTGSITALPDTTGPVTTGTKTATDISYTLDEYGEAPVTFAGIADLQSPHDDFTECVKNVAYRAGSALDNLAIRAAVGLSSATSSAPSASDVAWIHPLGPNTSGGTAYFNPLTDGLVKLGVSTATARANITSASTITADIVRSRYTDLKAKNVPGFATLNGNPIYACVAHPAVLYDLRIETGANAWSSQHQYTEANIDQINFGIYGVWEGFVFIQSSRMFYQSSGASSINIFPTLFLGADFLGKGYTPAGQLPKTDERIQSIALSEATEIRVSPGYEAHGRFNKVAWYSNVVYGIVNPYGAIRQEFATSNSSFKTATLSR